MRKATAFGESNKKVEEKRVPVFGIDLGTTNSAISVIAHGSEPQTIRLTDGRMTMPSCVMLQDGEFITGYEAYQHRDAKNAIYSVKRLMQNPSAKVVLVDNDKEYQYTPAEISAEILKGLVEKTGGVYGEIKDVVVTVPAYFDQNGVNATREACELAGLNLIGIANEPTAASLCYHLEPEEGNSKDVLVYDLGGGTFDVTIMRIEHRDSTADAFASVYGLGSTGNKKENDSVVTLGISGDMHLGGDDIDAELLRIVYKKLKQQGVDTTKLSKTFKEQLLLRLEHYKKDSVDTYYTLMMDGLCNDGSVIDINVPIVPEDFKKSAEIIFAKTEKIVKELLHSVDNSVKTIVLTGGSTKNPWIKAMLKEKFPGYHIDDALSPDLSVSQGAAIQGRVTKFGDEDVQIFDILPLTIGVLVEGDKVEPFIKNCTPLPITKSMNFTTEIDNQEAVSITLMQGNSMDACDCVSLGKLHIDGIEKRPAGEATLSVVIAINANRLMRCVAKIDGIEKEIKLDLSGEIKQASVRTSEEKNIDRLLRAGKLMGEDEQKELQRMIDDYRNGNTAIDSIKSFIAKSRKEKIVRETESGEA